MIQDLRLSSGVFAAIVVGAVDEEAAGEIVASEEIGSLLDGKLVVIGGVNPSAEHKVGVGIAGSVKKRGRSCGV